MMTKKMSGCALLCDVLFFLRGASRVKPRIFISKREEEISRAGGIVAILQLLPIGCSKRGVCSISSRLKPAIQSLVSGTAVWRSKDKKSAYRIPPEKNNVQRQEQQQEAQVVRRLWLLDSA